MIGLVVLVTTAASMLALALAADSNAPFDRAFAAQRGAEATVTFDGARVTGPQLAATRRLPGVTAAAGPFGTVTASLALTVRDSGRIRLAQLALPPMTVAGLAHPAARSTTWCWSQATGQPGPVR